MSRRILLLITVIIALIATVNIPASHAQIIPSSKPPKLAFDTIHGYYDGTIDNIAKSLGFETCKIEGNTIIESDLSGLDILVLFGLRTPYYTSTEFDLIRHFCSDLESLALYIIPHYGGNFPETYYNILYESFGFKVSGSRAYLDYPDIKNVTFTHPIMDGISHIELTAWQNDIATLNLLESPTSSILAAEGNPLFLVMRKKFLGTIFVDLIYNGIGYSNLEDNRLIVRNALIWLKEEKKIQNTESFLVSIGESPFEITMRSSSLISSFEVVEANKQIIFRVTGLFSTSGYCAVSIPKQLMWCETQPWDVSIGGYDPDYFNVAGNSTHTLLDFTYDHTHSNSPQSVSITSQYTVPEFPSFLILPLFMTLTLLAVLVYRRKHTV